jgi:hypothetical protein
MSSLYSADGMLAQKEAGRAPVPLERLTAGETDIGSGRTPTPDGTEWNQVALQPMVDQTLDLIHSPLDPVTRIS